MILSELRDSLKDKRRIVVKIGSSSLQHSETGDLDYVKMETLVRELCDLQGRGKEVVLVTSGAVAAGKQALNIRDKEIPTAVRQACAAVGQARLMTVYQKMFAEYNKVAAQILMTMNTITDGVNRLNAQNAFNELLNLGAIPIVNENDTIITFEIERLSISSDNDTLSAVVTALIEADLLILLSDIDGLYTDDPRENADAKFISQVGIIDESLSAMAKSSTGSDAGTGGMTSKINAAKIATSVGADMIIASSDDVRILHRIIDGKDEGTIFKANRDEDFYLEDYIKQ